MSRCELVRLGLIEYQKAWEMQRELVAARRDGRTSDKLLLLEHPPVYTVGRRGRLDNLLAPPEELERRGARLYFIERGGDVTFHGPGQLVGYPILDLKNLRCDVTLYLRRLEEVLIRTLDDFSIDAGRIPGRTGVWVEGEKIASIGIALRRWVTMHGFALNVNTDLSYFDLIVPCGLSGVKMTSMGKLLARPIEMDLVEQRVAEHFGGVFGIEIVDQALTVSDFKKAL